MRHPGQAAVGCCSVEAHPMISKEARSRVKKGTLINTKYHIQHRRQKSHSVLRASSSRLPFLKAASSCIYCFGNFHRIPVILVKQGKALPAISRRTATSNSPRRQRACDDDADDIVYHMTSRGCSRLAEIALETPSSRHMPRGSTRGRAG